MSFLLMSASDVHYGPTTISTEEANFHELIGNELTISTKQDAKSRAKAKNDLKLKELESKVKELELKKEKEHPDSAHKLKDKADKMRLKMESYLTRKQGMVSVVEGKSVKYDPNSKSYVVKIEDAPVRVLNKLGRLGYQVIPSSGGSISDFRSGQVWTLYRHGPPPAYPYLTLPHKEPR